jgi:hypothetical protein
MQPGFLRDRRADGRLPIAAVFIFATVPWVRGVARAFGGHLRPLSAHSE